MSEERKEEAEVARHVQLNKLGTIYQQKGKISAAKKLYTEALKLEPTFLYALLNLGLVLAGEKKLDESLALFQKACDTSPSSPDAWAQAAAVLSKLKRFEDSITYSQTALKLDPWNVEAHCNLNVALRCAGKQRAAVLRVWNLIDPENKFKQRTVENQKYSLEPPEHVSVICVKYGNKYDAEYVNKLQRAVERHLSTPHTFFCLTEDIQGLSKKVVPIQLSLSAAEKKRWHGWWVKALLFHPALPVSGRILYIDLDTVICGPLDDIVQYNGTFATLGTDEFANEARTGGFNSSMMVWTSSEHKEASGEQSLSLDIEGVVDSPGDSDEHTVTSIYRILHEAKDVVGKCLHRFDHWLEMTAPEADVLQNIFPQQIVEYAQHCREGIPKGASVINFPLYPKPHQVEEEWVAAHWV